MSDAATKYEALYAHSQALLAQLHTLTYGEILELELLSAVTDTHLALIKLMARGDALAKAAEGRLRGQLNDEEKAFVHEGKFAHAIQAHRVRQRPGGSLQESKDAVDRYRSGLGR